MDPLEEILKKLSGIVETQAKVSTQMSKIIPLVREGYALNLNFEQLMHDDGTSVKTVSVADTLSTPNGSHIIDTLVRRTRETNLAHANQIYFHTKAGVIYDHNAHVGSKEGVCVIDPSINHQYARQRLMPDKKAWRRILLKAESDEVRGELRNNLKSQAQDESTYVQSPPQASKTIGQALNGHDISGLFPFIEVIVLPTPIKISELNVRELLTYRKYAERGSDSFSKDKRPNPVTLLVGQYDSERESAPIVTLQSINPDENQKLEMHAWGINLALNKFRESPYNMARANDEFIMKMAEWFLE